MLSIEKLDKLSRARCRTFAFLGSFLLIFATYYSQNLSSNTSATSPSTISGSDTSPVSVSVSNSPLAYYISVSSSHGSAGTPVSLNYSQDGSTGGILGNVVSSSDNVYLETNSPLTHQLLLSTTSPSTTTKSNNLTGDNTQESGGIPVLNTYIAPVGNTTTSSLNSATTLSSNTWGFALSSNTTGIETNNFNDDTTYTSTDSSILNSARFTTVPVNGSEVLLTQDTEPISNTTIYYGVKADRDIPAGSYSNTVLYTALAEQPSEIRVMANGKLNPTIDMASPNQTLTVYTSISTTSSSIVGETATIKFLQTENNTLVEKGTCTNPSINLDSDNYLYVTCTTPVLSEGVYTVELTLTNLGRVLTAENVVTYSGDPLDGIETMQTFTAAACNRLPEADTAGNNIYTLKDSRDQKDYKIAHLADNNCWMVQNLALDGGRTLTPADSNVTQNRTLPANIANGVAPSYNDSQIYAGVQNQTDVYGSKYGNLYNYPASSATLGNIETLSTITESVCPKNWRLPDNSNYNTLIPLYYSEQDSIVEKITKLQNLPLSIPLPGRYDSTYYNSYEVGFYIARTVPSDNIYGVYSLLINNISTYTEINTLRIANKNWGMSVRCVFDS